jgi:arginine decarboxylase
VHDLFAALREIDDRSLREVYHDALFAKEQVQSHFHSGVLSLRERALAERLQNAIMNRIAQIAPATRRSTRTSCPRSTRC